MKYLTMLFSAAQTEFTFSEFFRRMPQNNGRPDPMPWEATIGGNGNVHAQPSLELQNWRTISGTREITPPKMASIHRMMDAQYVDTLRDQVTNMAGRIGGGHKKVLGIKMTAPFDLERHIQEVQEIVPKVKPAAEKRKRRIHHKKAHKSMAQLRRRSFFRHHQNQ